MRERGEVAARLIDVMQDGICGTATELAARVRVDARSVRAVLRMWLDAGIVHVVEEVVPGRARVFRYGGNEQPAGCLPGALRDRSRRGGGLRFLWTAGPSSTRSWPPRLMRWFACAGPRAFASTIAWPAAR